MACNYCNSDVCRCDDEIKEFNSALERLKSLTPFKTHWFLYLPQNVIARLIYIALGGKDNRISATLLTYATTNVLFHYLLPRLIGHYFSEDLFQDESWMLPKKLDVITAGVWTGFSLCHVVLKKMDEEDNNQKYVDTAREYALQRIQNMLNNSNLEALDKEKTIQIIKAISNDYQVQTEDQLITLSINAHKTTFFERYNSLTPSIYYRMYEQVFNIAKGTWSYFHTSQDSNVVSGQECSYKNN